MSNVLFDSDLDGSTTLFNINPAAFPCESLRITEC